MTDSGASNTGSPDGRNTGGDANDAQSEVTDTAALLHEARGRLAALEQERASVLLRVRKLERERDEVFERNAKLEQRFAGLTAVELGESFVTIADRQEASRRELQKIVDTRGKQVERLRERVAILGHQESIVHQLSAKILELQQEVDRLSEECLDAEDRAQRIEQTIAFRLGQAFLGAFKSINGFVRFPGRLIAIGAEARRRRKSKGNKTQRTRVPRNKIPLLIAAENLEGAGTLIGETRANPSKLIPPEDRKLRVASIMDEFTVHSFAPECDLLELDLNSWRGQIADFKPDFLFVESAWRGFREQWKQKISTPDEDIVKVVNWCRLLEIPVVFWNKEDPVHFGTFLSMAALADYVFTTDIDCIPKYKQKLGHDRVFLLPFAAQPVQNNPIEKYDRKDAINFAGSYYLRYPERQRDFDSLISASQRFRKVEIFDRNHGRDHEHYVFPERFAHLILGSLPFAQIDKAYKGYRFGVNVNTIKQSQTMFARRVFELLASNTITISNFSRGLRLLFGDLVIASDDEEELAKRLEEVCESEVSYRKFRLMGLRKTMAEHCYTHRLSYVRAKLADRAYHIAGAQVAVVSVASTERELETIIAHFNRQNHAEKSLIVLKDFDASVSPSSPEITICDQPDECAQRAMATAGKHGFLAFFLPQDFYGPHYLTDLALADMYSNAKAFGKPAYYLADGDGAQLVGDGTQYRSTAALAARSSLVRSSALTPAWLIQFLSEPEAARFEFGDMLGLDEFHYCQDGATLTSEKCNEIVGDFRIADEGVSLEDVLYPVAENLPSRTDADDMAAANAKTASPEFSGVELLDLFIEPQTKHIRLEKDGTAIELTSALAHGKFGYIWCDRAFTREECNFVLDSRFKLHCETDMDLRTVFEFQDEDGKKIAHAIMRAGDTVSLPIPQHCTQVRFGLRVVGRGTAMIHRLSFGGLDERPALVVGKSRTLVVARQYPSYHDLYSYGFLHSRLNGYRKLGVMVDMFRLRVTPFDRYYHEFEGTDVATGDDALLDATLSSGSYDHVAVHLLYRETWALLKKHIDRIKVTAWVHGAEIQPFHRREFNMVSLPQEEIERQKKLGEQRMEHWRAILSDFPDNLHLVFVSQNLADEAMEDIGLRIPEDRYSVIHNPIDTQLFDYVEKEPEQRCKILSIRPYSSKTYANDLTVAAILALRGKPFFDELEFCLVGDGPLFEATVAPLRDMKNVVLEQRFLPRREIARLHKRYGVCLTPTRMDTQGVSRDEAMASGLVPVTSRVAAVPEFVDETCGFMAEAEDYQGLADAIEALYHEPDMFTSMSKAASERVRSQSSADHILAAELALFSEKGGPFNAG